MGGLRGKGVGPGPGVGWLFSLGVSTAPTPHQPRARLAAPASINPRRPRLPFEKLALYTDLVAPCPLVLPWTFVPVCPFLLAIRCVLRALANSLCPFHFGRGRAISLPFVRSGSDHFSSTYAVFCLTLLDSCCLVAL